MMSLLLNERQRQMQAYLQEKMILFFPEIQSRFGTSRMTAHRDVDRLVQAGVAEKIRGGLRLFPSEIAAHVVAECAYCRKAVPPRTAFVIHLANRQHIHACCPHCGLLILTELPGAVSAMAVDFIHGHEVNVKQAVFLVGCDIQLCCTPTVLCLGNVEDAARLQAGFGGQVLAYAQALQSVRAAMDLSSE